MGRHAATRVSGMIAALAIGSLPYLLLPPSAGAAPPPHQSGAHSFVTVMTRNMDEGTDFGYITAAAGNPTALNTAIVNTYCEVVASKPEQRAAQIADEIAASQPDIVSLQEVAGWTGSTTVTCPGPVTVAPTTIDAETALLDELAADGANYYVVTQLDEFNSTSIFGSGLGFTFLDRDVLLARQQPARQLQLANVQAQHFNTLLVLPLAPELNATILRGWMSVDATVGGRTARVISTHLESFYEPVQQAQAAELATGPAATTLPVILAGDLNTGPGSQQTASYNYLTQTAGFVDTWAVTQPGLAGYTDAFYTEDPLTPSTPSERIDLILVRGATVPFAPKDFQVGNELPHPSDHAGVVAKVTVP